MKRILLILMAIVMMSGCGGCDKYDRIVLKDQECLESWSNVEAQYQRRSDMIPALVNVVKGAAKHEKETLTAVMEARSKASSIQLSADDLSDPKKLAEFEAAQGKLKGALSRLMMVQESYPELKSNRNFENLMVQIEGTENRILIARKRYNSSVKLFNYELRKISGRVINPATGNEFMVRPFFKAAKGSDKAPEVNFDE